MMASESSAKNEAIQLKVNGPLDNMKAEPIKLQFRGLEPLYVHRSHIVGKSKVQV